MKTFPSLLFTLVLAAANPAAWGQARNDAALHNATREGDLAGLRSLLAGGADPNQRDAAGERPLVQATVAGQLDAARLLLGAGANPNLPSANGRTALTAASQAGRIEFAKLLIQAGADLDISERGAGTALEAAEREGHTELATLLRRSGARTSGRSVDDKVCVRPWKGEGYCGIVSAIAQNQYTIRVSEVVGCANGCSAMPDCSAGKLVGGSGLRAGDTVAAPASCLTHTGVSK